MATAKSIAPAPRIGGYSSGRFQREAIYPAPVPNPDQALCQSKHGKLWCARRGPRSGKHVTHMDESATVEWADDGKAWDPRASEAEANRAAVIAKAEKGTR